MYDISAELSILSNSFQTRETPIVFTYKLIRIIRLLKNLKDKNWPETLEAHIDKKLNQFDNLPLSRAKNKSLIATYHE